MSKGIKDAVEKIYGNSVINLLDDISINKFDNKHVIEKALEIENKYGITLSSLIAEDRGLGQGYFINSDKIPTIKRALWSKETKLKSIVELLNVLPNVSI